MKKPLIYLTLAALLLVACTAPVVDVSSCVETEPSGFWMGLWHGIIAPITFIISIFTDSLQMYDINNNGGWYDFGFVLGAGDPSLADRAPASGWGDAVGKIEPHG